MIEINSLGKYFGDHKVLSDISLKVDKGDVFGIVGHSGAGKSTLLRCLNGLESYTEGSVRVGGKEVRDLDEKELKLLRRDMGMIFQNFNLMNRKDVFENILFPLKVWGTPKNEAESRVNELLELVGLTGKRHEKVRNLSGGQKQRVGIARALALNPEILLCDEATSALDPNTTRQILDLLKEINEKLGVTIVVITHEMRVIDRICDSVAVIDSSHIAEVGKVSAVFSNPQSQIARDLIVPKDSTVISTAGGRRIRLIFDGKDKTNDPLISRMVLECGAPVNILFADTRIFEGVLHGHMVIELPNDKREADKIITWLSSSSVNWKEEI